MSDFIDFILKQHKHKLSLIKHKSLNISTGNELGQNNNKITNHLPILQTRNVHYLESHT